MSRQSNPNKGRDQYTSPGATPRSLESALDWLLGDLADESAETEDSAEQDDIEVSADSNVFDITPLQNDSEQR